MSGLVEKKHKDESGKTIRHDPARELATKFTSIDELKIEILTRMDLCAVQTGRLVRDR